MKPIFIYAAVVAIGVSVIGQGVVAQTEGDEQDRVAAMAEQLQTVMDGLGERAESYPVFIQELQDGLVTIEQADEEVAALIEQLTLATDQMDDQSDFDGAIDEYKTATVDLIAFAEASNNSDIIASIPDLQEQLAGLEASDDQRAETVIEARNLIRTLEQNREALAFFIRANQVQRASALIQVNVDEFAQIVSDGKELAGGLMSAANP
jgi:ABC-type transporter Mla subunit MlaD